MQALPPSPPQPTAAAARPCLLLKASRGRFALVRSRSEEAGADRKPILIEQLSVTVKKNLGKLAATRTAWGRLL
eukprot:scaffold4628_cov24-Tisochrysis_lutea.AAC.1